MNTTRNVKELNSYRTGLDQQGWSLVDCHAAEHMLIGTHGLDGKTEPVCVTCQLNSAPRAS